MIDLILVRHALALSNRDGVASGRGPGGGLTDEGREQARALGAALGGKELDLGVATGHARTLETLELALAGRDVPRIVVSDLGEIDFGDFEAGPLDVYRAWAASEPPDVQPPGGGESRAQVAARYARGLRTVLERSQSTALVVGHALAVRYVLDAARGLVPAALLMPPVEHAKPFFLSAAEVQAAASLLEEWSGAPAFRDPPSEGRAGS